MLELQLRVEDDVLGKRISRRQDHARSVESSLPLTTRIGILPTSEFNFTVGPETDAFDRRGRWRHRLLRHLGGWVKFEGKMLSRRRGDPRLIDRRRTWLLLRGVAGCGSRRACSLL